MTETNEQQQTPENWKCPLCGGRAFFVNGTWTVANGDIHRQRVCAVCEHWGFTSVEKPQDTLEVVVQQTAPATIALAETADPPPPPAPRPKSVNPKSRRGN